MMRRGDQASGCIYAFADPGCPGVVKIGKDQKWPQRFRQARSHSPRGMLEVGRWRIETDEFTLHAAEQRARRRFQRECSPPGVEWVRITVEQVRHELSSLFGHPLLPTPIATLKAYDDWRDWVLPRNSLERRRVWIGLENRTGRLKVVHTPKTITKMNDTDQTYSFHGIAWREAWTWETVAWAQSKSLHPLDRHLIALWNVLVEDLGFGPHDGRVGWLREGIELAEVNRRLVGGGLTQCAKQDM